MLFKRTLPLLGIMLILASCIRQAPDDFDTVGSQNTGEIGITQVLATDIPTEDVVVIDPNATDVPNNSAQVDDEPSATARIVPPTEANNDPAPTNTQLTIPTATQPVIATAIPTATELVIITPGIDEENPQPVATATEEVIQPTLEPTPTAIGGETVLGDCDYEIQNGDNLFRIALNNNVDLTDLLTTNGLTEASVIQPGQILTIPNCDITDAPETTEEAPIEIATAIVLEDCDVEIQAGDTLFNIAIENEVTLAALLAENGLVENAIIQPGQIITIPNCEDGDEETAVDTAPSETSVEVTEAAVVPEETIHEVIAGDTLLSIARQYGVSVNSILQANTIPDPNSLTVGQQLVIPDEADG